LSARNVLVGEGEVCKITEFGMARDVKEQDIYVRAHEVRMGDVLQIVSSLTRISYVVHPIRPFLFMIVSTTRINHVERLITPLLRLCLAQ